MLAACGSSGGGTYHGNKHDLGSQLTVQPDKSQVSVGKQNISEQVGGIYTKLISTETNDDKGYKSSVVKNIINTPNDKLDVLRVDGKNLPLVFDAALSVYKDKDFYQSVKDTPQRGVIGKHLQHARYGVFAHDFLPDVEHAYLFSQGRRSTNVPKEGQATYQGRAFALVAMDLVTGNEGGGYYGTSKFNVDFGKKSLDGTLSFHNRYPDIKLRANINGNIFRGTGTGAKHVLTEGGFYGPDAAELAGTFHEKVLEDDLGDIIGGFGATKINPVNRK